MCSTHRDASAGAVVTAPSGRLRRTSRRGRLTHPAPCQTGAVIDPLQTVLLVAALVLALVTGGYVALDRSPDRVLVALLALLEAGLVVQAVLGIAQLIGGSNDPGITFVGYLLAVLVILPLGLLWSLGERSRGATAVLIVALLTVAFLVLRLVQIHVAA